MITGKVFGVDELWQVLKNRDKILMYGTGNGADKILRETERRQINIDGFFASDGFVRDRFFHGKRVMSLEEAENVFGDFTVLMAFGSARDEVIENVKRIMARHEFFAPDVPVADGDIFDGDFYLRHENEINKTRALFSDEASVKTYDGVIKYKLSGDVGYLFDVEVSEQDATELLSGGYTTYIDLGAYNGDTISKATDLYSSIKHVFAFEPAKKPFEKLSKRCSELKNVDFSLFNASASEKDGTCLISDGGGRGSQLNANLSLSGAKTREVRCMKVDSVTDFKNEKLLIKYDVEGEELNALNGSVNTAKNNDTDMIVSLYHRSEDIFMLPQVIRGILPNSKLYLRKLHGLPAWDINLYVCR